MSVRVLRTIAVASVVLVAAAAAITAQDDKLAPGSPHQTRLTVGELPPTSFALPAAGDGTIFDLEAARGERPILLLFFRGTW